MGQVIAHVKEWKKNKVEELTSLIKSYPVIGLINLEALPSKQFQSIRAKLRKDIIIRTAKKPFITRAFEKTGHKDLTEKIPGSTALVLTKLSPSKVVKLFKENKSRSPIKPGQVALKDLIIPEGETPFTPGPIIGELGQIGVKAKIVAGKINVLKDAVVVKAGEPAGALASTILAKLNIKPIEIGLNLVSIKQDGLIYTPEMLDIDVEAMIALAYTHAKNLVLNTGIIVPALIKELLQKAQLNALALNGVVHPEQAVQAAPPAAGAEKKEAKKEEVEEEEVSDTEAAAGLGALFG